MTREPSPRASRTGLVETAGAGTPVIALLATYIGLNRAIPDLLTVPVGVAIHPSELTLVALLGALAYQQAFTPRPLPRGPLGLVGITILLLFSFAPMVNAASLEPSEIRTFDQGLVITFLYATLFVASYQAGIQLKSARLVTNAILIVSIYQAFIATIEGVQRSPAVWASTIWTRFGLTPDAGLTRSISESLNVRLTGELRVSSTAPHPLVLSALMAVSCAILVQRAFDAKDRTSQALHAAGAGFCGIALAFANSRTGMLVLAVAVVLLIIANLRHPLRLLTLGIGSSFGAAVLGVFSPNTLRLALDTFTFVERDHNVEVRLDRLPLVMSFLEQRPLLGAGYLTNDATVRQLWDNAYLHALSELGMFGLAAFLVIFAVLTLQAGNLWSASPTGDDHTIAIAGVIAGLALLVSGITLDAWTFDQFLPTMLVVLGVAAGRLRGHDMNSSHRPPASPRRHYDQRAMMEPR